MIAAIVSLGIGIAIFLFSLISEPITTAIWLGLAGGLITRGIITVVNQSLVYREIIIGTASPIQKVLNINRYIFWKRLLIFMIIMSLYLMGAGAGGLSPLQAILAIPSLILAVLSQVGIFFVFMLANVAIMFGPFLIYGKMGRTTLLPGDGASEVKMNDVRGQKSPVSEMRKILALIEQGRKYVEAGGKRERGVLMVGPPGTGKTMLAKAIASELHMPIMVTSGSSFAAPFMGMDMINVWTMMRAAKKLSNRWGGCVIFIDEFDALGNRRGGMGGGGMGGGMMGGMMGMGGGGLALNMLLVQMDGLDNPTFFKRLWRRIVNLSLDGLFIPRTIGQTKLRIPNAKPPKFNILFLGATNRPSVIDEALTRPGRFGRTIFFRLPTRDDRKDIAELYFAKKKHDPLLDTTSKRDEYARITEGYSPAMIEQSLSLALMYAFEDKRDYFNWHDLRESMSNIEAGLAIPVEYTERDKIAVARHEMGHAVASQFFKLDHSQIKLSIKRRSTSHGEIGGYHLSLPTEEIWSKFRSQMAAGIRHDLGSLACERVFYGENSTGVFMDLQMATNEACHMVGLTGMGGETLDPARARDAIRFGEDLISISELSGGDAVASSVRPVLSNPRSRKIVAEILGSAYIDDWRLMNANKEAIDAASEILCARGEIVGDEIDALLSSVGLRMFTDSDPYPAPPPELPKDTPLEVMPRAA